MPGPPALGVIRGRGSLGAFLPPRPGLGPRPRDPMKPNKLPKLSPEAQPVAFLGSNQGSNPSHNRGDFMPPAAALVCLPGTHTSASPPNARDFAAVGRLSFILGGWLDIASPRTPSLATLLPAWAAGWTRIHSPPGRISGGCPGFVSSRVWTQEEGATLAAGLTPTFLTTRGLHGVGVVVWAPRPCVPCGSQTHCVASVQGVGHKRFSGGPWAGGPTTSSAGGTPHVLDVPHLPCAHWTRQPKPHVPLPHSRPGHPLPSRMSAAAPPPWVPWATLSSRPCPCPHSRPPSSPPLCPPWLVSSVPQLKRHSHRSRPAELALPQNSPVTQDFPSGRGRPCGMACSFASTFPV